MHFVTLLRKSSLVLLSRDQRSDLCVTYSTMCVYVCIFKLKGSEDSYNCAKSMMISIYSTSCCPPHL